MALVKLYLTEFFEQLNTNDDITLQDVIKVLSKLNNIPKKLANLISASCWGQDAGMQTFLKPFHDNEELNKSLKIIWMDYIIC